MSDNVLPPVETPIMFLAGEFGCKPQWYAGFMWQSPMEGQEPKFYIYAWFLGFDPAYPHFNAPPYLGQWQPITDERMLNFISGNSRKDGKQ